MSELFGGRVGCAGFTLVARAPGIGVPAMSDGSWHVVAGENPAQRGEVHAINPAFVPFILDRGGDVVLYRLPMDDYTDPVPVLSKGGMRGRSPDLAKVAPFNPELMRQVSQAYETAPPLSGEQRGQAVPVRATRRVRTDRRAAWATAAAFAALLAGATGWVWTGRETPSPRWVPDLSNPRDAALAKGAMQVVMARPGDPDILEVWRVYPTKDGTQARDLVDSFQRRDYERSNGYLPDSPIAWRRMDDPSR